MTFTDVLALTGLSAMGLLFWLGGAVITSNEKAAHQAVLAGQKRKLLGRIVTAIGHLTAVAMVFAPWVLMLTAVAQRILGDPNE